MARYIAKNVVAAGLSKKCEVEMSFVIGKEAAQTVHINTFGTQRVSEECIGYAVNQVFDFTVAGTIQAFDMRRPIYKDLAAYGHFGRSADKYAWEKIDKVQALKDKTKEYIQNRI